MQEHARRPLQHPGVPGDCAGDLPGLHRPGGRSDDLQLAAPVPDDRPPVQLRGARAGGAQRLDGQDRPDPGGADAGALQWGATADEPQGEAPLPGDPRPHLGVRVLGDYPGGCFGCYAARAGGPSGQSCEPGSGPSLEERGDLRRHREGFQLRAKAEPGGRGGQAGAHGRRPNAGDLGERGRPDALPDAVHAQWPSPLPEVSSGRTLPGW